MIARYWKEIGITILVFIVAFAATMIATSEPITTIVIRHGIKNGVQFSERWCRRQTLWSASETRETVSADGSRTC